MLAVEAGVLLKIQTTVYQVAQQRVFTPVVQTLVIIGQSGNSIGNMTYMNLIRDAHAVNKKAR